MSEVAGQGDRDEAYERGVDAEQDERRGKEGREVAEEGERRGNGRKEKFFNYK